MPRKKAVDTAAADGADGAAPGDTSYSGKQAAETETLGLDNFELPKSQVGKLAKSAIPENVQVRKEVQQALVKSSTVFINYLALAAQDAAAEDRRKTISGSDVLVAIKEMELPKDMHQLLVKHLNAYRRAQTKKREANKKPAASDKNDAEATEKSKESKGEASGDEEEEAAAPQGDGAEGEEEAEEEGGDQGGDDADDGEEGQDAGASDEEEEENAMEEDPADEENQSR